MRPVHNIQQSTQTPTKNRYPNWLPCYCLFFSKQSISATASVFFSKLPGQASSPVSIVMAPKYHRRHRKKIMRCCFHNSSPGRTNIWMNMNDNRFMNGSFFLFVFRCAKDIDTLIDSLPSEDSSPELQIQSLKRLEAENQEAAEHLEAVNYINWKMKWKWVRFWICIILLLNCRSSKEDKSFSRKSRQHWLI